MRDLPNPPSGAPSAPLFLASRPHRWAAAYIGLLVALPLVLPGTAQAQHDGLSDVSDVSDARSTATNEALSRAEPVAASEPEGDADGDIPVLETMRAWTYRGSHAVVSTVDSWFGDEPFDQRGKVSGYVRVNTLWEEGQGTKANARFRLRAGLPNLQRSAYAFVGQDNEREEIIDQPEAFRREQLLLRESRSSDQSFFAGLGYALRDDIDLRLGVRGGFNLYAQARYRTQWMLSPRDAVYFRESLFWSVDDSFGSTTALDYEHALSPTLVLRWANVGTVTRRSDGFEWQSSVGFFKDYPGLRTASVEALVQGRTGSVDVSNYGIRSAWRQPLYKDWLFGKLTVGHFWPRDKVEDNRRDAWAVDFGLEMHF